MLLRMTRMKRLSHLVRVLVFCIGGLACLQASSLSFSITTDTRYDEDYNPIAYIVSFISKNDDPVIITDVIVNRGNSCKMVVDNGTTIALLGGNDLEEVKSSIETYEDNIKDYTENKDYQAVQETRKNLLGLQKLYKLMQDNRARFWREVKFGQEVRFATMCKPNRIMEVTLNTLRHGSVTYKNNDIDDFSGF
ncbi:hypothetical protein NHP200010_07970 [Helicobacter bizzozeronii]|nr:hypothetical protein NHP200010_07970 [Helicobacter bizzozeronii]